MRITKAKLVKGNFLEVTFDDGNAVVSKSYPNTNAPPKLLKTFMALNAPLCELTEQYDKSGQLDYDNVACRGYAIKGEGEAESFSLTGIRTLSNCKTLTIPKSPSLSMEDDDSYPKHATLIQLLDNCRQEIVTFMENNKSPEEIQGRLFDKNNKFVMKSDKTAQEEEQDIPPETAAVIRTILDEAALEDEAMTEQERMDEEMLLTQDMIEKNEKRKRARKHKNTK